MSNQETMNEFDEFLNYSSRNRTNFLSKWKEDGSTIVWLSTQIAPKRLWRHPLRKIVQVKNQQTHEQENKIWSQKFVCLEPEDILKDQNFMNRLTGERKRPPHTCPICLFNEHVRGLVLAKKLDWLEPVLVYATDQEEVVVHAQGLVGYPKSDKLKDAERKQLAEKQIFQRDAWKEDLRAKMNWIFCCAEHRHPEKGLQVAIESASLGDKVKSQIGKEIEKADLIKPGNGIAGNPLENPYPFKWSYTDAEGVPFGERYDATALVGTQVTPEIDKLIRGEAPIEMIQALQAPPDLDEVREALEKHCVLSGVPFDALFAPARAFYLDNGLVAKPTETVNLDVGVSPLSVDVSVDTNYPRLGVKRDSEVPF